MVITINRPEARNAVNGAVSTVVGDALAQAVRLRPDGGVIPGEEPDWARTEREVGLLLRSEDAKEGPLAFAEKRLPVWKARLR
jgi:enoyl-CoA hydratase/carnithine racemase